MSKFEYTGEFREPAVNEWYEPDYDKQVGIAITPTLCDRGPSHIPIWGKRRPIMRKVEPIKISFERREHEESERICGYLTIDGRAFDLNGDDLYDVESALFLAVDSGREIVYAESTGEKDEEG